MTQVRTKTRTKTTAQELQRTITADNLYQPDKFNVHLGTGTVGFCTAWNEPISIIKQAPELLQKAAIIGTLYSPPGVNIIIRNLALNPHIHRLYLWGHGQLSNTKFGAMGTSTLKRLWKQGVSNDSTLINASFKLDPQIDIATFNKIRRNVKLINVSKLSLATAVKKITSIAKAPYMPPVRFPDTKPSQTDTFPSEQVGWLVRDETIIAAWTRVVERIMRYGTIKGTQYGSQQKELIGLTWVIHNEKPDNFELPAKWPSGLQGLVGATRQAINEYHRVFLSPNKPPDTSYTYGNRLMKYPMPKGEKTIDQITDLIIGNLKKSPNSRRAVATTLVPWIDAESSEPPCITQIQCLQTKGKISMLVTVRSHDIFKAAIPNAFGLRTLQARIAKQTGFELGALQITSQSAHIYESDWNNANKLSACSFWKSPTPAFSQYNIDPRGTFCIRLEKNKIVVDFNDKNGANLLQFTSRSADHLVRKISQHELFSKTDHALDIGLQLARAEIALHKNIPFTQDQLLKL